VKKLLPKVVLVVCLAASLCGCGSSVTGIGVEAFLGNGSYLGAYWPTDGWRTCRPEEVGMDSERLALVYEYVANPNISTEGVVVIKDGYIVGEAYFGDWTVERPHASYSLAKSFTSALVGMAVDRGLIGGVDNEVYTFFPEWQTPETPDVKKRVTVRHLLRMMGGLEWREDDYYGANSQDDIPRMYRQGVQDFIQYVLDKPVVAEPGTQWYYSSGESILLSGVLEAATGQTAYQFARQNLFAPLGMSGVSWESDPAGHTITGWGIDATVRDYAKFGYLYLMDGQWGGEQLISASWVEESTSPISDALDHYGSQWWLPYGYASYREVGVTEGTLMAAGMFIQRILVIPDHGIVAVRVGNDVPSDDLEWETREFIRLIQDAVTD
jgi:CubicO group peptidase (beta-lactamase class C family)